ncbi:glyoxalase/bleomycin resistance protein/dioxygenase superfamily protein [Actinocorallia herbida]|uniref:Glyoxalase/bleomycin resistance protein/dioxygenase superfamily protein n=1 Tax=Actinocorallia herbida TaxID=58109 RepID=A0A3N1D4N3_9ACTN|nr:VOC family protein [Actinocorallia herbida]ROO88048.1 glyoxalase/bleomycin resistance protein/dioxygenase superfamily protein [Actinocorallia herbida]
MPKRPITHLRHVDFAVPDYDKQRQFYESTWGLTNVGTDGDITYYAAEGSPEQYVIRLRKSEDKRLDLLAFGSESPDDVDTLAQNLASSDVQLITEPGSLQTPGGGYGFRFFDVDGRVVEISADVEARQHRKVEEREAIPVRLAHAVINSPNPEGTRSFYERHLGFDLSDTLRHPAMGELMYFMRCNPYHHNLAITRAPHASVHHVSFEMRGIEEWMRGGGRAIRAGAEKIWGPGRHMAGDNLFMYFLDPHGNGHEYTYGVETLDEDTWHPHVYDISQPENQDQWGTAGPMTELITKALWNTPDPLFSAPPA